MSMTRHDRRLLEKSRKIRTDLDMLYSFRELLLQKEEDRAAAELHEAEKAAGRRFAEENFEKLDAEHVKAVILKSRIAEAENELNELKTTLLINGIHPEDAELMELQQRHEARLNEIAASVEKDMESFVGGDLLPNVDISEKTEAIIAVLEEKKAKISAKYELKCKKLEEKLSAMEKELGKTAAEGLAEDTILSVRDLKMYFGGVKAVDGLSFDVKEGEIFGLIGPNGAGKTTVFNCITQFYKPTSGTLLFRGKQKETVDLCSEKVHDVILHGIVRTFQNVEVVPELSVLENLLIAGHRQYTAGIAVSALHLPKLKKEERIVRARAEKVLEFLGLKAYASMSPAGLPYGILKKIEIARTLMCSPRLIILDEPAAGLNDTETAELAQLIRRIRDEYSCTVLLVEHDMGLVMDVCDNICAISFGKLLAYGTPEEIQANKDVQQAYLGVDEEED